MNATVLMFCTTLALIFYWCGFGIAKNWQSDNWHIPALSIFVNGILIILFALSALNVFVP